jgi:hypothetical protein
MTRLFGKDYSRQQLQADVDSMDQLAGFEMGELTDGVGRTVRANADLCSRGSGNANDGDG